MQATETRQSSNSSISERIYFLDNLRAIAIIMVVGVHSLSYCVELPHNYKHIVLFIVITVSVPVFILVDGYLFARSVSQIKSYSYRKYVRSSIFRLLIPWAIFTLIYTFARYAFEVSGFFKEKLILGHSWQEVVVSAYGSVYSNQMYFLLSLFLIRLCSPLFKKILFHKNYSVMIGLFFSYYAIYRLIMPSISPYLQINGGVEPVLHAFWGIQFYLVGIVLFKTSEIFDLKKLFIPFLLIFILTLFIQNKFPWYGLKHLVQYQYLLTLFLLFSFFSINIPPLNLIGKNTLGIYLIHAPIVLKGVSMVLNKFELAPMVSFISILFCTLVLSIGIVIAFKFIPFSYLFFGTPKHKRL